MALAVTPDGSAVTGYSFNTLTGNRRGLVWSGGVMTALEDRPGPDLDLGVDDNALPEAISDDGRTVVGVGNGTDGRRLGRWVDSQIEVLWNRRLDWSMSFHVLSDRRIISVSMGGQNRHTGESYGGAMVWRAGLGITSFEHHAALHHGLDL